MVEEVLRYLNLRPGSTVVDATSGTGGHSLAILPHLLPNGCLIAVDQDPKAQSIARQRLIEFQPSVHFASGSFRNLSQILSALHISKVDGLLLDLGMSSLQVDSPERGFSFLQEGPLDMRMDPTAKMTASDLVNTQPEEQLLELFSQLGEERFANRIARHIVAARRAVSITTTTQLAQIIVQALPAAARRGRLHPATRVFQALRMAVNDELGALSALLSQLPDLLAPKARAIVLTFHSLEDRPVKRAFAQGEDQGFWKILTKHVVKPSREEVLRNPRARSAKLRAIERC
ncbi:MAG: 16S rRNA (cytosine(1402)-N(4))-methyltransferase RsmH [Candidatus Omnitrophica bacterium]|nr:16S rRNA (cytosine(1402)-N(4))-methyltransferase RsmH [Candidatus Omnitrophota bacterium]MBI2174708.1 16S rRNA (cytosine(1402)-N(4))-methyltransferase RsmH [Candidatus Omnitrophota bacterium]MBI3010273.1 16S rRNA (cytosine(1402)-N(4))-methyltransferase RsmH [Candidatus Omnitrophota bacterium]